MLSVVCYSLFHVRCVLFVACRVLRLLIDCIVLRVGRLLFVVCWLFLCVVSCSWFAVCCVLYVFDDCCVLLCCVFCLLCVVACVLFVVCCLLCAVCCV